MALMLRTDKDAAERLAMAFLRKKATQGRFLPSMQRSEETASNWIFDFYHPRWREFRRRNAPFGMRIAVDKQTGTAAHYATLQEGSNA